MTTYHLISWGANSHGQLGQNIMSDEVTCPQEVPKTIFEVKEILKIVGGAGHTLVLDINGRVYSCGWNCKGQAGISEKNVMQFSQVRGALEFEFAVDITCGWDSSAAITKNGALFVWGSNNFGQLGLPDQPDILRVPTRVAINEIIVAVSMGLRHTAITTKEHCVFVTGENKKGQLGLLNEHKKCIREFTKVPLLNNIEDVSCGQYHTVAKTKSGEIYVWGDNKYGQLGKKDDMDSIIDSISLSKFGIGSNFTIHTGWSHTAVLSDGYVYAWGRNTYGQLGYSTNQSNNVMNTPNKVQCSSKIKQLAVGSQHNVAITEDEDILSWGWNEHGNCGNGTIQDVQIPESIMISKNDKGILVGAGAGHSFALIKRKY